MGVARALAAAALLLLRQPQRPARALENGLAARPPMGWRAGRWSGPKVEVAHPNGIAQIRIDGAPHPATWLTVRVGADAYKGATDKCSSEWTARYGNEWSCRCAAVVKEACPDSTTPNSTTPSPQAAGRCVACASAAVPNKTSPYHRLLNDYHCNNDYHCFNYHCYNCHVYDYNGVLR